MLKNALKLAVLCSTMVRRLEVFGGRCSWSTIVGDVTCLSTFSKTHVLSGSADHTICIWRASDWNCVHILGGHK